MCRQLQHNSGRLSGGVTADYVLQLKGSANDEPKVSTRAARHPERHAVSQRQPAPANVSTEAIVPPIPANHRKGRDVRQRRRTWAQGGQGRVWGVPPIARYLGTRLFVLGTF